MQCCELSVFYLFFVEIQVHLEVRAIVICLINITINYPSHLQQDTLLLSDVSHTGRVAWGRFTAVAGSFAIWPTAEKWLGLDSSFLPSLCVSSLTHNHFSLPVSLQSQLPLKSLPHTTFPVISITTGFYSSSTVSSLQIEPLMLSSSFIIIFKLLVSFVCMPQNQRIVETGRNLWR